MPVFRECSITKLVSAGILSSTLVLTAACGPKGLGQDGASDQSGFYCDRNPAVCAVAGVVIVAGIALASDDGSPPPALPSDTRLKTDVRRAGELDNGLTVYAFRFKGDDRYFAGLMADELLEDQRFAHAVRRGDDGYLRVDYAKLGVNLDKPGLMAEAGRAALGEVQSEGR